MAIKDVFKVNRKTFFNPRGWIGYDELANQTQNIWDILKNLIAPAKPQRKESFTEAMQRLNLTEADLKEKSQTFINYTIGFILLGFCSFIFSFYYLLHHHTIAGFLIGLAVTILFATQAFRFHFWHFQIKHRKLGCTFAEWRNGKPFEPKEPIQ
jgi:intracellular multiplication protein IcmV